MALAVPALTSSVKDAVRLGALRGIQNLFFHTPLVRLFITGSHVYHDSWWWKRHGRKRMARVARETQWGRLFADYAPRA